MSIIIGTPHTHNAGYYRSDNRASGGELKQADVRTCTHCQCVIKMQAWKEDGAWCGKCNAPICANCGKRAATRGCEPFMKTLEQYLARDYQRAQFLKMAGLEKPDERPSTPSPGS